MSARTIAAAAAVAGLTTVGLVGLSGSASAAGACPTGDGWQLAPVAVAIDAVDNGQFADNNGDGLACFRVNKGQTDKHDGFPSFTWKDNTN